MRRQRTSKRRPPFRTVLTLELLEERTLLSTMDGSFQAVMLTNLRNDPAFSSINGHGIGIAVIDTGVYAQNPDLQPNFVHWYDAVTGQDSSYTTPSVDVAAAFDPTGHGSHVAGIAAASDPSIGVAPGAELIGIRAVPQPGEVPVTSDPVASALEWVIAHRQDFNIQVVNLSVGTDSNTNAPPTTDAETTLISQLQGLGVAVVSAAGNAYADFLAPGVSDLAAASTLAVASTWATAGQFPPLVSGSTDGGFQTVETSSAVDRVAASSQRSTLPNQVAAPGQNIVSDWNGDGGLLHNTLSGTSMAAPMVSGAIALMQQAAYAFGGRYLDVSQVVSILRSTADTITDSDVSDNGRVPTVNGVADLSQETALPETGISLQRINIYHAVQAVKAMMDNNSGGSGGAGSDQNNLTSDATGLPPLDGLAADSYRGNIGQDGSVQVGAADVDLYEVRATEPGILTVQIAAAPGSNTIDAFVRIFDSSGNEIDSADTGPGGAATLTTAPLPAGTYFVGISGTGNAHYNINNGNGAIDGAAEGDYSITVSLSNPDPNGTLAGANPVGGIPANFQGDIGSNPGSPPGGANQVDMYQVVAPDDGVLTVAVDSTSYGSQGLEAEVRVFDAQGNQLAAAAAGNLGSLQAHLTIGEIVYVAVSDASNSTYDPNDPFGRTATGAGGKYNLSLTFDNGDADGTTARALPIGAGAVLLANVGTDFNGSGTYTVGHDGSKDVDWYFFQADETAYADVKVTGQGFIPDLSLWQFNVNQGSAAKIAESVQTNAELIFPIVFGQSYYFAVTGQGNNGFLPYADATGSGGQTGPYTLSYDNLTTPPGGGGSSSGLPNQGDLTIGVPTAGNLGMHGTQAVGASSFDLYRFVAPATEALAIRTDTAAEGSANTFLRFFDASGNELAYNDNANANTTSSLLVVLVQAGQTYYIGVSGAGANPRSYDPVTGQGGTPGSTGPYTLELSGQPTATLAPLPRFSLADFTLSWSGQPGANGPSIASYDVYVSDNGAAATAFLKGTTQTSAVFHGQTGHTYSFYVIAADQLGNRSAVTPSAQTATHVDTTPPVSSVAPLPAFSGTTFQVQWSGADDPGGSGIASFDIYVSDNGGVFVPFLRGTAQTSTVFQGQEGHRYGFFSVAVDGVGNRQPLPGSAEAVTLVDTIPPVSSISALPAQSSPTFNVSWSGMDPGTSGIATYDIFVSVDGGPFTPFLTGTTQTSASFQGQAGHSYAFYSIATDEVGNRQAVPVAPQAATLVPLHIYVTSAEAGGGPDVKVFDADTGQLRLEFFAFDPRFTGGVRIAVGDVDGDGVPDIICAAGPGGGPNISIFNGLTGQRLPGPLGSFYAYDPHFTGGVYVAAGDVNGDGFSDIVCGADAGGGPNITVFSGKDGSRLASFFAYDSRFTGGVRVATGDVNGDGRAEIIAGTGPGGGPNITIFDAAGTMLHSFFAFAPSFTAGIYVAAGDLMHTGQAQIVAGAGAGGGPNVAVFTADGVPVENFFPFSPLFAGGVRVAAVERSNGHWAIVSVAGPGGGPNVQTVDGMTLQQIDDFFAYDPRFSGGLYVAAG